MSSSSQSRPEAASAGEAERLFSAVYDDLRRLARRQRGPGDTLDTTALVHELYLRMASGECPTFGEPRQFFAYAARAMRHLLIDRARHRLSDKSGGRQLRVDLEVAGNLASLDAREALQLDEALRRLEGEDARAAQVVELHYFGGLSIEQVAELLQLTSRTINRDLLFARAFIKNELDDA